MSELRERILARCERRGECLIWQGAKTGDGYGGMKIEGRFHYVHVLIFEIAHGPVPEGKEVDHKCRIRDCVEPRHLRALTHAENLQAGGSAKLTPEDVAAIRASGESSAALALRFGVDRRHISDIRARRRWKEAA